MKIIKSESYTHKQAQYDNNLPPGTSSEMVNRQFSSPENREYSSSIKSEISVDWDELKAWMLKWGQSVPPTIADRRGTSNVTLIYKYEYDSYNTGSFTVQVIDAIDDVSGQHISDRDLIDDIKNYYEEQIKLDVMADVENQRGQMDMSPPEF